MKLVCKCGFIHQDKNKLYYKRDYSGRRLAFCYCCDRRIVFPTVRAPEFKKLIHEIHIRSIRNKREEIKCQTR